MHLVQEGSKRLKGIQPANTSIQRSAASGGAPHSSARRRRMFLACCAALPM
jgi:hypothetical protein